LSSQLVIGTSSLNLIIKDDGQGFSLPKAAADGQGGGGMGLRIMGVRAASIGGRLEINPGASGGVQVSCVVPLQKIAATPAPEKLA
jgi:signal transduction histidine kinase